VSPAVPVAKEVRRAGWGAAARHWLGPGAQGAFTGLPGRRHLLAAFCVHAPSPV